MDDHISRQMAIEALERIFDRCEEIEIHLPDGDPDKTGYKMLPDYMIIWKYLHQLSSAQPERIRGRWERWPGQLVPHNTIWWYVCSACGGKAIDGGVLTNFCPNCGADMREGQDD